MGVETASYLADLVDTNPLGSDNRSAGDDHIRLMKTVLQNTFPAMGGAPNRISYTPSAVDPTEDNHVIFHVLEGGSTTATLPSWALTTEGFTLHYYCGENMTLSISPYASDILSNAASPVELTAGDGASFINNGTDWTVITHYTGVLSFNGLAGDVTLTAADLGLGNVENKSSETIRDELTSGDVIEALGYTPQDAATAWNTGNFDPDTKADVGSGGVPAYGEIGSLLFAISDIPVAAGASVTGSHLSPAGINVDADTGTYIEITTGGTAVTGTWRCLGQSPGDTGTLGPTYSATLFQRIS